MTFLQENPPVKTRDMLIGALLRVPAQAIQRRIIKELNAAGFEGLSMPHMAVLRFPSPDGDRPGVLAERAGMSKQAMNRLLGSLEDLGFDIVRSDAAGPGPRAELSALRSAGTPRLRKGSGGAARISSSGNGTRSLGRRTSLCQLRRRLAFVWPRRLGRARFWIR